MQNREISRQLQKIQDLYKKTSTATGGDIELQSSWAKYLCILSAGLLENSLKEIYGEFANRSANKQIANFANMSLSRIRNPNTNRFTELVSSFDVSWRKDLEVFLANNGRGDAIDSIMNNRHQIAHGQNSGITLVRIKEYLDKAIEVVEYLETQCR